MTLHLLGFGSLMHTGSLGRALGRPVSLVELRVVVLSGFRRDWRLREDVLADALGRPVRAGFLDLRHEADAWVNATVLQVDDGEYARLRAREKNYDEVDVTALVTGGGLRPDDVVMTSVGHPQHRASVGAGSVGDEPLVVMQRYLDLVDEAVAVLGSEFSRDFALTTDPPPTAVLPGRYTFIDPAQAALV